MGDSQKLFCVFTSVNQFLLASIKYLRLSACSIAFKKGQTATCFIIHQTIGECPLFENIAGLSQVPRPLKNADGRLPRLLHFDICPKLGKSFIQFFRERGIFLNDLPLGQGAGCMNEHPQVRAVDHDGIERKISGFAYDFLDLCGDMFMIQAGCILSLAGGIGFLLLGMFETGCHLLTVGCFFKSHFIRVIGLAGSHERRQQKCGP